MAPSAIADDCAPALPPVDIPESPLAVLLPVTAVAAVLGATLAWRRRADATAPDPV